MYENAHLTFYPNPILRKQCRAVTEFNADLIALAQRMFTVMYRSEGVGLAAPQVGIDLRLFVLNTGGEPSAEQVLINPEVVETVGRQTGNEGCLSFPGISIELTRPKYVRMKAQDLSGEWRIFEGVDLTARCYLHELDHLNGLLLIDRMSGLQKLSHKRTLAGLEEDYRAGRVPAAAKLT